MFERKKYKQFAKEQLSKRWGIPIVITLISFIVLELFNIPDVVYAIKQPAFTDIFNQNYSTFTDMIFLIEQLQLPSKYGFLYSLIQELVSVIFIVACINVYLKMSRSPEKVNISVFFEGFNDWARASLAYLWVFLWTFLWMLLFIIPGIIKSIAYSQTYYLISEYKNMSVTKAMNISKIITKGHKGDLFVMGLSFIGWGILATLTCGIGFIFLIPYARMSFVNAYHGLLKEALDTKIINPEDLA